MSVTLAMTEKLVHTQEFSVRVNSRVLFGNTGNLNALAALSGVGGGCNSGEQDSLAKPVK